jgi:opacity protein-like surface antigen
MASIAKKMLLIGVTLLFVATAFADDANNSDETLQIFKSTKFRPDGAEPNYISKYMDGENHYVENVNDFYIRISGGLENDSTRYNLNIVGIHGTYDASGVFGVLTLGYGRKFFDNAIYFGAAIDGTMNSALSPFPSSINYPFDGSISIPYSVGAYLVTGTYATKSALIYIKAGGVGSKYEMLLDGIILNKSFDRNMFGYRIGGGLDLFLNKYVSFDIEYLYTDYRTYTYQSSFYGQTYSHKFEPSSNQISLGLACHLG